MDIRFVITLSEHRIFGFVFSPYLIKKERQLGYYSIYDRVTNMNLSLYESMLSPEEIQLVKIIEEYNEPNLAKLFSKKKVPSREFVSSIKKELFAEQIRPFIERRMAKCIEILVFNPVPVYNKVLQNNIYEDDRIKEIIDEGSTVFNFLRTPESFRYFLSIEHNGKQLKLTGKKGIIIVNEPACIIADECLFVFRDIDGKKLTPFLEKEFISVPHAAEKKFFETFVRNSIKKYKVYAEGFTITNNETKPEPVISIERDLAGKFLLILKFIYAAKNIYYANRKTEPKVTCEFSDDDVHFLCLQRDYNFENDCIAQLLAMGLVNHDGPYFKPLQNNKELGHSGINVINWVNFNSNFIRSRGFLLAQDKLDKNYYLDDFSLKIEASEKNNDWFDIDARVEFAGFKIPFASLAVNILNGEREFILPDGRIMILPEEWFESYRDLLKFSKIEKGTITLDKLHFALLNKNIHGVSEKFKANLLSLIEGNQEPEEVPGTINATLRPYQVDGYSWLYRLYSNSFGGCLADDMGLGKTLQTLTMLNRVISEANYNGPEVPVRFAKKAKKPLIVPTEEKPLKTPKATLIIVPTSLVHNWINETLRFVPSLRINTYIGSQRKDLNILYQESDIILTSYGILRNDLEEFMKLEFLYLVLDESQMIKNPGSKTYQSVLQLKSDYRLVLTGTPIENSLTDLWAQINFLNPGLLGSLHFFKAEFQLPVEKFKDENKQNKLRQLIAPFVLRRSKGEVAKDLPPINEQVIYCNLDEQQEAYYEREKSKARNLVIEKTSQLGYGKSGVVILQSLTLLRQIANHPVMVDENYFYGSGKFDEITRNLESLSTEGHKVLVFSSFVKHLDLIGEYLDRVNLPYALLTGETKNREKEIKKFQETGSCQFFLISLKAGGVGLNLTAADYVFILDPWWNPAAEIQAISRAHRIGQEKHVFVYRFIARNTLEEKILKLQERKSILADIFLNNSIEGITEEQIMELFN
jgi:superfamily II DNA or RNA helicase